MKLANHTYTCLYGTFLCNTDAERATVHLENRTWSIWSLLNGNAKQFVNHLFNQSKTKVEKEFSWALNCFRSRLGSLSTIIRARFSYLVKSIFM